MRKPTVLPDLYAWHRQALAAMKHHNALGPIAKRRAGEIYGQMYRAVRSGAPGAGGLPQITQEPQCGWFKRRLVKGGPWVPARIWLEQPTDPETGELAGDEVMRCEVGGKERDPVDEWTWLCSAPITEADFLYLTADAEYLRTNVPAAPEANPTLKVLSRTIPPLF